MRTNLPKPRPEPVVRFVGFDGETRGEIRVPLKIFNDLVDLSRLATIAIEIGKQPFVIDRDCIELCANRLRLVARAVDAESIEYQTLEIK
jgi:hypothetical protein